MKVELEEVAREIRFVGLKRSGNHAILNWIIRQSSGSLAFFNDVRPEEPFERSRLVESTTDNLRALDTVIYSVEDTSLAVVADNRSYPQRDIYPEMRPDRRIDILLLRDPFNLFASRFQRGGIWSRQALYITGLSAPQMWTTYALESLNRTNWLRNDCITINYDLWCTSEGYRRRLAEELDLEFTDEGFTQVKGYGGGSSFESTKMDGRADKMGTGERWKRFADDPAFLNLFRDPLLLDLAEEVFELDDELSEFVQGRLRPRASMKAALRRQWSMVAGQRAVARLRRSVALRALHRSVTSAWRKRNMPIQRPSQSAMPLKKNRDFE